jgi:ribosomal protein S27E
MSSNPSLRPWKCRNCGRANRTEVFPDGTVRCDHCSDSMRIQPSGSRGGETAAQLSRGTASTRWSVRSEPTAE